MSRISFLLAIGFLSALASSPVDADSTPAPPEWNDRPSVYRANNQSAPAANSIKQAESAQVPIASPRIESNATTVVATLKQDTAITGANHEPLALPNSDEPGRRLAPPSRSDLYPQASSSEQRSASHTRKLLEFGLPTESIYTVVSALVIVVGAFLIFAWALRRGTKKANSQLPADVASVLGRVPLAARQFAELLRVGNKLVLISLTPNGAETLTEVTDPVEVDRLLGLCQQHDTHSTTKAFEQVFQQLSSEPGRAGFFGEDSLPTNFSPIAGAYRAQRGAPTRA
jgi:flagellar biogenesis protein FliO